MSEPAEQAWRNIGRVSTAWLRDIGLETPEDLRRVGSVAAYAMVKRGQPSASLNLLWSLEGAIRDIDWRELSDDVKSELRAQLDKLA